MQTLHTEVAVVGAGPIGLELAVNLKRAGIDYQHFDARQIGYTVSWFAPGTRFFSSNERIAIAGVPLHTADQAKASREEYLNYLRGVVELFDLKVNTYEPVVGIAREGGEFVLSTRPAGGARVCRCRKLVLVTGGTDHPRRLNVPGEGLPHVSAYFRDPHLYFRRRLLIVGGKNSAIEAALRCHHAGANVSLSYRGPELSDKSIKYWLMPEITDLIRTVRIHAYFNTRVSEITPMRVMLARTQAANGQGETGDGPKRQPDGAGEAGALERAVDADFVLLLIGYEQDNALLRLAGVDLAGDCQGPIFNEQTMETTVPGLYVAGTSVAGTQDKYRVFIENCHVHVERIMASLTGAPAPVAPRQMALPES